MSKKIEISINTASTCLEALYRQRYSYTHTLAGSAAEIELENALTNSLTSQAAAKLRRAKTRAKNVQS